MGVRKTPSKMGFLAKAFKKITPKKKPKKQVAENSSEVQSDGEEEGSILSVALEEQISQILDVEEDDENLTEDASNDYNDYNEQNPVYSDGDNKIRRAKNQKGAIKKNRKIGRKPHHKEDISIAMSGVSLIFCLLIMLVFGEILYGFFNPSYPTKSIRFYNHLRLSLYRFNVFYRKPDTLFERFTRFHNCNFFK